MNINVGFQKGLLAIFFCIILVIFCYQFVDRAVVLWIYQQHLADHIFFKWLTYFPEIIIGLTFLAYLILLVRRCQGIIKTGDKLLLLMANSIAIAYFLKDTLKIFFGRSWPDTWVNNNPSFIKNGVYGFHWLHGGTAYASFPSGHTTIMFAAMTVLWIKLPRLRWLAVLFSSLTIIGLIAMNYHFIGDIIAGAFLGTLTAFYTIKFSSQSR